MKTIIKRFLYPMMLVFLPWIFPGGVLGQWESYPRVDILSLEKLSTEVQMDSLCEWIYLTQTEADSSIPFSLVRMAEKLLPEINDKNRIGCFYKRKGGVFGERELLIQAIFSYQMSLEAYLNSSNQKEQAGIYCRIGNLQRRLGFDEGYLKNYRKAQELYKDIKAEEMEILPVLGQMSYYLDIGNLAKAKIFADKARKLALKYELTESAGEIYNAYGSYYYRLGEMDSALFCYKKAFAFYDGKSNREMATIYFNIGKVDLYRSNYSDAINNFRNSIFWGDSLGDQSLIFDASEALSRAFMELKLQDSVIKYIRISEANNLFLTRLPTEQVGVVSERLSNGTQDAWMVKRLEAEGWWQKIINWAISVSLVLISIITILIVRQLRRSKKMALLEAENQHLADAQRIVDLMQEMDIRSLESKIEGVNEERERLAIELHDGLGSTLSSIKLYFSQLEGADPEKVALFDKANRMLDDACQSLRDYAHNLAGNKEVAGGLALVVQNLAATVSGAGSMKVQVFAHDIPLNLTQEFSRSLYKIVQELLSNAIKHSNAKNVTIQFTRHQGHLNLLVEDDGVGFPKQILSDGMGLSNVRQRVLGLGGDISIDSTPGRGATFLIDIPIDEYDDH